MGSAGGSGTTAGAGAAGMQGTGVGVGLPSTARAAASVGAAVPGTGALGAARAVAGSGEITASAGAPGAVWYGGGNASRGSQPFPFFSSACSVSGVSDILKTFNPRGSMSPVYQEAYFFSSRSNGSFEFTNVFKA